jgi:hypothetical protein
MTPSESEPVRDPSQTNGDNGQTGSIGASQCLSDADCENIEQARLDTLKEPQGVGASFAHVDCIMDSVAGPNVVAQGIVCDCTNAGGGSLIVGLDCAQTGRHGECIYPADEFPGCELGVAQSCSAVCEDLQARLDSAAARTYDAKLLEAHCNGGNCTTLSQVDDTCHLDGDYVHAYDCADSLEQITEQRDAAQQGASEAACHSPDAGTNVNCPESDAPVEHYYPRDPEEWQGMLVDIANPLYCEGFCGLALACIDQQCLPCQTDEQCLEGEGCSIDHCVPLTNLECRSRKDCAVGELCILSGYTGGTARANEDMRAYCVGSSGSSNKPQ